MLHPSNEICERLNRCSTILSSYNDLLKMLRAWNIDIYILYKSTELPDFIISIGKVSRLVFPARNVGRLFILSIKFDALTIGLHTTIVHCSLENEEEPN